MGNRDRSTTHFWMDTNYRKIKVKKGQGPPWIWHAF